MKTQDAILLGAMAAGGTQLHDHHHSTTVKEYRAPTDDSIRLAKEYEEKAWNAVAKRVLQDVPGFNAKFVEVLLKLWLTKFLSTWLPQYQKLG
jgi:hypothetical protein